MIVRRISLLLAGFLSFLLPSVALVAQPSNTQLPPRLPHGVEQVCSILFDKDMRRPARVEDNALPCLDRATQILKDRPGSKLVLVATADPEKDHADAEHGDSRMQEDDKGTDIRFEDIAMYRGINTKDYLTRWDHADPSRVIPTTNEHINARSVTVYLVPGDANFIHNYLETTKTNEKVCTVKPCPDPREETLTPQPRGRIRISRVPAKD